MELDASEGVRDEAPPAPAPSRARAAPKARTGRTPKSSKVPRAKSSRPRSRADAGEPRPRKGKIPAPLAGVLAAGRGASPTTAAAGKPPTLPAAAHPPPSTETDADAESATSPGPAPAPASDGVEEDRLRRSLKAAQRRMRDIVKQSRKEQMALQSRLAELEAQVRSGGASPGSGSGSAATREAEARAAAAVATGKCRAPRAPAAWARFPGATAGPRWSRPAGRSRLSRTMARRAGMRQRSSRCAWTSSLTQLASSHSGLQKRTRWPPRAWGANEGPVFRPRRSARMMRQSARRGCSSPAELAPAASSFFE